MSCDVHYNGDNTPLCVDFDRIYGTVRCRVDFGRTVGRLILVPVLHLEVSLLGV